MMTKGIIAFIGLSQSLFVIILLSFKNGKTISDRIMIAWFITIASLFLIIINTHTTILNFPFDRRYVILPVQLSYGPFLFVYVSSVLNNQFKLGKYLLIHFLPILILTITLLIFSEMVQLSEDFSGEISIYQIILLSLLTIVSTFYAIKTLLIIINHQRTLKDKYSSINSKVTLRWIFFITIIMIVGFISLLIIGSIERFVFGLKPEFVAFPNLIGFTIFAFAVSYYGVRQSSLNHHVSTKSPKFLKKFEPNEQDKIIQKINNYMISEKPYIKPDLTIQELADYLDMDRLYFSEIINNHFKKNFYTFINEYRVQEVKIRLQKPEYNHLTLLAIGFDSGFNSKTSFNTIFKQFTGKTPSEYQAR
jgi:AraC-like DNA-binding protein